MRLSTIVSATLLSTVALSSIVLVAPPAEAQPAFALGKPLADQNAAPGTVIVRVVAGSTQSPATGVAVTLLINGTPREARTDAEGRATFAGIPTGAKVKATVLDVDGKETASDEFPVPGQGGTRVLLTTKPFTGGGTGAPMPMGGPGGMPEARVVSGQPRPDGTNLPGSYGVRLTYNNLAMGKMGPEDAAPPVGEPVKLVAYGADDTVKLITKLTDQTGVATFEGLDQSGGTAYYALANLHRGTTVDRMVARPVVLDSQSGARVVLSGEKKDASAPGVDDYSNMLNRDGRPVDPGKVRVVLDGIGQAGMDVNLYDIATMQPIATGKAVAGPPDRTQIEAGADIKDSKDVPVNTIDIVVNGGPGNAMEPQAGISVVMIDAETEKPIEGASGVTDASGKLRVTAAKLPPGGVRAVFDFGPKQIPTDILKTLDKQGMTFEVRVSWPANGKAEVLFDAPPPGKVVFAETVYEKARFRSLPFETLADAPMTINVFLYPRTLFAFDTLAFVEDQLLAVQGSFEISNWSWAPYRAKDTDGITIKLPPHFKGAIVSAANQAEVAVEQGTGFRIMRPIPPGGTKFRAGFSMPIEDGKVDFKFDLPLGTMRSQMRIRQTPGMTVALPPGLTGETRTIDTGEQWYMINDIRVDRGGAFAITVSGFPSEPAWKTKLPRILGVLVLAMIIGGVAFAIARKPTAVAPADLARREQLLDELVALEKRGIESTKDRDRREKLIEELERTWGA